MSEIAIKAENLGKQYRIGARAGYKTIRETFMRTIGLPGQEPGTPNRGGSTATFWALKDVSFEILQGEVVGIIGRNGAGKSTLLKILSRITEPTTGQVELVGRVGSLLEVGTGFHPELSGRENVYLNGAILGMQRHEIESRFDEIVAFSEIEKFLDTPVKHYSSGMYMRLAFAVAAHLEPEILIVDEVLAVGDAEFQKKCMGKMKDVAGHGRTVLFVSHNLAAIQTLTQRCILLEKGEVRRIGDTREVTDDYVRLADVHVRAFADLTSGAARQIITGIEIRSDGRAAASIAMGAPVGFAFRLAASAPGRRISVGLGIENTQGVRIVSVNSHYDSGALLALDGAQEIRCALGRLPLTPGVYTVRLVVSSETGVVLEDYPEAAAFEIVAADVYGNAFAGRIQRGFIHWRGQWDAGSPSEPAVRASESVGP